MDLNSNLVDLIRFAESMLFTPYVYGGNSVRLGLDCSGYINIILRSVGLVGMREDLNAQGLYDKFVKLPYSFQSIGSPASGSLLFYGHSTTSISHVSLVASPYSVLECGGGGSTTTTKELADLIGAGVRKCGIHHRTDKVAALYPQYPWDVMMR